MTRMTLKTKPRLRRTLCHPRRKRFRKPAIKFSPTAWAKLRYLRDLGPTEVGGFGITSPEQLLSIQDVQLVAQQCTEVTVQFDDTAVAAFFEEQVDQGRRPEQFGRIWIHTHPGSCPLPSAVDLETFQRCFGRCDWAVMLILARDDSTFAELAWRQGGARIPLQVEIDYSLPFAGTAFSDWEAEYLRQVQHRVPEELQDWVFEEAESLANWRPFERTLVLEEFP